MQTHIHIHPNDCVKFYKGFAIERYAKNTNDIIY